MNAETQIFMKKLSVLVLALLMVGLLFGLSGCFEKQEAATTADENALTGTGSVEATAINVAFKIPGKIAAIPVNVGDAVTSGQEVASVESDEIEAKVAQANGAYNAAVGQQNQAETAIGVADSTVAATIQQAQAGLEQAKVALESAQETYDRVKPLYDNGFASQSDYDDATNNLAAKKAQVTQLEGQLAEAEAAQGKVSVYQAQANAAAGQSQMAAGAVQEAQVYLNNTHIYSPINGYVTSKIMEAGEMVNAGTPVLEITDLAHAYVQVYIDESKIGRVQLGQKAEITVPAYPDRVFTGSVTQISNAGTFAVQKAINEQYSHDLQSFEVRIDLDNSDLALKVGMTATVKIDESSTAAAPAADTKDAAASAQ